MADQGENKQDSKRFDAYWDDDDTEMVEFSQLYRNRQQLEIYATANTQLFCDKKET